MRQPPALQKLVDVDPVLFERYLKASGDAFAGIGPKPDQATISAALMKSAEMVNCGGAHAQVLALRYSFFVTILTENQDELVRRGLLSGGVGPGLATRFTEPFVAACARCPAKFAPGTGFVYSLEMFWKLVAAAEQGMKHAQEPSGSAPPQNTP